MVLQWSRNIITLDRRFLPMAIHRPQGPEVKLEKILSPNAHALFALTTHALYESLHFIVDMTLRQSVQE